MSLDFRGRIQGSEFVIGSLAIFLAQVIHTQMAVKQSALDVTWQTLGILISGGFAHNRYYSSESLTILAETKWGSLNLINTKRINMTWCTVTFLPSCIYSLDPVSGYILTKSYCVHLGWESRRCILCPECCVAGDMGYVSAVWISLNRLLWDSLRVNQTFVL